MKPLCFVLMPFRTKPDPTGGNDINFNRVYEHAIKPAIEAAGMEPIRADEEKTGGIIHKAMFERLLLCDFAVADLTTANANVFYELGIRHAVRPATTVTIFADHQPIPFDINFLRSLPYELGAGNGFAPEMAEKLKQALTDKLVQQQALAARDDAVDSPLFQLVGDWKAPDIAHIKTDIFREQVAYNEAIKNRLAEVRELAKHRESRDKAAELLAGVRADLTPLDSADGGTVIDLMLTYRALSDWRGMVDVQAAMPKVLAEQILVQEQLGFALNRMGADDPAARARALKILQQVEDRQGANPETCGLIGRIYKDYWSQAMKNGNEIEAAGHLKNAIDAYLRGFMADQRDSYPGINAVTLLDIKGDPASLETKMTLLPVVRFAVMRRLDNQTPDYWDHATMLELAILENNREETSEQLGQTLAKVREAWEPETTQNNLQMIADSRAQRGEDVGWLMQVIEALRKKRREMLQQD